MDSIGNSGATGGELMNDDQSSQSSSSQSSKGIRLELIVKVKTVNVNSEPFKRSFSGSQPPILMEPDRKVSYTDNRDLEGRIFHIAKEYSIPLFEKDKTVEKNIESLYRNFKMFLRCKTDYDKLMNKGSSGGGAGRANGAAGVQTRDANISNTSESLSSPQVQPSFNKLIENLASINALLRERGTRYLLGSSMTEYDCELMPRLHHIRVAGGDICGLVIPSALTYLWNYMLTTYRTAAFIESVPFDQDIIHHYKEQLNLMYRQRMSLQTPTKTCSIPEDALGEIKTLALDK